MTDVENYIIENINNKHFKFPAEFDPSVDYSDDFYIKIKEIFQKNNDRKTFYRVCKRIIDLTASFILLVLLAIPLLIVSIAIKIDSKGPVLFKQQRMGRHFKPFTCYKFRSMAVSAPSDVASNDLKKANSYITKMGKFIRKTSIDELAQLFNVFIGNMSLIGYRPIILSEEELNNMRNELGVFKLKPGITGYAQILGRDDVTYKNKALIDACYVKNSTIWFDVKIVFKSISVVFSKKGNRDDNNRL